MQTRGVVLTRVRLYRADALFLVLAARYLTILLPVDVAKFVFVALLMLVSCYDPNNE